MYKYLLKSLIILLIFSSVSYAATEEAKSLRKLQAEYGYDLTKAPFFLRFAFTKSFNLDWKKSDFVQREYFLREYEINYAADQAKEKLEAKQLAASEKEKAALRKQEILKEKDRLRARLAEEKAEKIEDTNEQKQFDITIKQQERELAELEQEAAQGSRK